MIFTFPYYDPNGRQNQIFARQLENLQQLFTAICISVVPPTDQSNAEFVTWLKNQNCVIYVNPAGHDFGDHARNALRVSLKQGSTQPIFFSFLDRVLFALETKWKAAFIKNIWQWKNKDFLVFERSQQAYSTHPDNYRESEQFASKMLQYLTGKYFELTPCAFIFSSESASRLTDQSVEKTIAVYAEWILLAMLNHMGVTSLKTDWLTWEDPFWENVDAAKLKQLRETSPAETIKRPEWCKAVIKVLLDPRFKKLRS
jgi:hypothetical protein